MTGTRSATGTNPSYLGLYQINLTQFVTEHSFSSRGTRALAAVAFGIMLNQSLWADYKDSIGYNELRTYLELRGLAIPDGAGIEVTQVEVSTDPNTPTYLPNTGNSEFIGKSIIDVTSEGVASGHATSVGRFFYGNETSTAPGITMIYAYEANDFLFEQGWATAIEPPTETSSIQNHSWVAQEIDDAIETSFENLAMDYAIQRDDFLLVAGLNNGSSNEIPDLYGHLCNGISVGRADGNHSSRTTQDIYFPGRTKPEIVSDASTTSSATPQVSAAASLIYDLADGNIDHRAVKAILLAGADKTAFPSWDQTPSRPIDETYGAGLLNIFAAYKIFQGGMQGPSGDNGPFGWNLGSLDENADHTYTLQVPEGFELRNLSVLVTWDIEVTQGRRNLSGTLGNLALQLNQGATSLQISDSPVDNIEHIWRDSESALSAGEYTLVVTADRATTYAIAWRGELYQDYELWQAVAFSPSTPESERSKTEDPDQDGRVNLLEMALLSDPELQDSGTLTSHHTTEIAGDVYDELTIEVPTHENGLSYLAETTADLNEPWSSESSDVSLVEILQSSEGFERYVFRLSESRQEKPKAFLRLKISD